MLSTIYGHGGHLVYVTCTIYITFCPHYQKRFHKKFGIGHIVSEENIFVVDRQWTDARGYVNLKHTSELHMSDARGYVNL